MNKKSIAHTLRMFVDAMLEDMHTSMAARVESYDYKKQMASVKPVVRRRMFDGTETDFPVISHVPVIFPRTSAAGMHMPVTKGDTGLLVFSERSLDRWLNSKEPVTDSVYSRKFDLTDAVFIPGMLKFTIGNPADSNNDFIVYMGESKIKLKKSGDIELTGGNDITIKKNGDIVLGSGSVEKLMNKTAMNAFNKHTHLVKAVPATETIPTLPPSVPMVEDVHTTSKVEAQ